jgi:hypothetical protein
MKPTFGSLGWTQNLHKPDVTRLQPFEIQFLRTNSAVTFPLAEKPLKVGTAWVVLEVGSCGNAGSVKEAT